MGKYPRRADAIRPYAQGKKTPSRAHKGERARSGARCAPLPIRGGQGPGRAQFRFSVGAAISRPQRTAMGSPSPQAEGPLRGGGSTSRPVICIGRAGACPCRPQAAKSSGTTEKYPRRADALRPYAQGAESLPVGRTGGERARSGAHCALLRIRGGRPWLGAVPFFRRGGYQPPAANSHGSAAPTGRRPFAG